MDPSPPFHRPRRRRRSWEGSGEDSLWLVWFGLGVVVWSCGLWCAPAGGMALGGGSWRAAWLPIRTRTKEKDGKERERKEEKRRKKPNAVWARCQGTWLVLGANQPDNQDQTNVDGNERILVSEVVVRGATPELERVAKEALHTKANFAYTLQEVQEDVNRVFATGYFAQCKPVAEDTRDGVKLTVEVTPNQELRGVVANGANALPQRNVEEAFRDQYGKTLNFTRFGEAIRSLNKWYEDHGVFGQVVDVDMQEGIAQLKLAEAVVGKVNLKFLDGETGEPTKGKTQSKVIMRQIATKPGAIYNIRQAKRDIDAIYSMGLADDVNLLPQPAEDSSVDHPKVDLTINVVERSTGGFSAGGGISAQGGGDGAMPGFVGSCSYSQRNLFGLGQKLTASLELGQADSLFRIHHTDPWVSGDPNRTSRTISIQNNRSSGGAIHGKDADSGDQEDSVGGGNVSVGRLMGGVEYGRPLSTCWSGVAGITWQKTSCSDEHGRTILQDSFGSPLTFSGKASDTTLVALIRAVYGSPTGDSQLVLSMEQAFPLRPEWVNFNRLRARAERTVPLGLMRLALSAKGGAVFGDLPPYEAFAIGGTNTVRGYSEGGVGSAKNYVVCSSELHAPLISPVEGCLFVDYGTDLDSGASILGDPAGMRGKPGRGYGYGAGVRIDSPVGPLRLEYAFKDRGAGRFHFGIGSGF